MNRLLFVVATWGLTVSFGSAAEPPATRLVYRVTPLSGGSSPAIDSPRLVVAAEKRCNPGMIPRAMVRLLDDGLLQIDVYWHDASQVERIERALSTEVTFEIRILASNRDDADIIARARKSNDRMLRGVDGKISARWVKCRVQGGPTPRDPDCVIRKDPLGGTEALVLSGGLAFAPSEIQSARPSMSDTGRPSIVVKLSPAGRKRVNEVLQSLRPYWQLGRPRAVAIILNDLLYSAPGVMGEVGDCLEIDADDFCCDDVELLAGVLDSGPLPARLARTHGSAARSVPQGKLPAGGLARAQFHALLDRMQKIDAEKRRGEAPSLLGLGPKQPPDKDRDRFEFAYANQRLLGELIPLVERAYSEAPGQDAEVTASLRLVAYILVDDCDYAEALRISRQMIEGGKPENAPYTAAGLAAFALGDFDLAGDYLTKGESENLSLRFLGRTAPTSTFSESAELCRAKLADYKKGWQREQQCRAVEAKAGDLPHIVFKTVAGDIEVELFLHAAPKTVANVLTHVEQGHYKGQRLQRIFSLKNLKESPGDPTGAVRLEPGPPWSIPSEAKLPQRRLHFAGTLSMVSNPSGTVGPELAVALVPAAYLDDTDPVFGRVVKGMDLLAQGATRLRTWCCGTDAQTEGVKRIIEVHVVKMGDH